MSADNPSNAEAWTPATLATAARALYAEGPRLLRLKQVHRSRICPLHRIIPLVPPGSSVLDVGCGGGVFLGLLAGAGRLSRGIGFDASHGAIDFARHMAQRLGERGERLEFHHLVASDPWPVGAFGVVSIIDVMHHVAPVNQRKLLDRAIGHVGPSGRLIYKDIGARPRWRALASRLHDLALARELIHLRPIDDVESWAAEAGLRLTHAEDINQFWYGHELRVFQREEGREST